MSRRYAVLAIVCTAACRNITPLTSDGGNDAPPADAAVDAPPDAPDPYSISVGAPGVVASSLVPRTVTITGNPNDHVQVAIARTIGVPTGKLTPTRVTLDAAGNGTASYMPCNDVSPGCTGSATLTLALASAPDVIVAHDDITLDTPAVVGEIAPCMTTGNVMYLHGNDYIYNGVLQSNSSSVWSATTTPDQIEFDVATTPGFRGIFSLVNVAAPLAPGLYDHAQRAEFAASGHPGLEINSSCNMIDGRFQVYDYTADPVHGTVYSVTISFEQVCDNMEGELVGCFHYETQPTTPPTPPAPDPTKVSVQVLATTHDGSYDPTATAIFTDSSGNVALDTQVDAFGEAQVALPSGGALTTIQHVGGYEYIHSYRGLVTGDHVVVNAATSTSGAEDLMRATFTAPPHASTASFMTACGGGSWSSGTGPVAADLAFFDGCRTSTFDMLSIVSFSDMEPQQFVWQTGIAHVANGNVQVPASWAPMGTATVTLANVPASSPPINTTWSTQIDAKPVQMSNQRLDTPVAGDQSMSLAYPPGAGDGTVVTEQTFSNLLSSESRSVVRTDTPSSVTLDFATQPIPLVSAVQTDATGATWTETAGGTADARTLIWTATLHTGTRVIWTLVEPYDGLASSVLPTLPASHAAEDPTVDATAQLYGSSVNYVDYNVVSGFALSPPTGAYTAHSSGAETYSMQFPF